MSRKEYLKTLRKTHFEFWEHMHQEHDLLLTDGEIDDIIHKVEKIQKQEHKDPSRIRYFIATANCNQPEFPGWLRNILSCEGFPTERIIIREFVKANPKLKPDHLIITSLYEFENREDFKKYQL